MFTKDNIVTNTILYFSQRFTIISIDPLYRTIVQLRSLGATLNMYKRSQPRRCLQRYTSLGKQATLQILTESQIQTRFKTNVWNLPIKKKTQVQTYKGYFILNVNTEELIRLCEGARMKKNSGLPLKEECKPAVCSLEAVKNSQREGNKLLQQSMELPTFPFRALFSSKLFPFAN